MRVLSPRPRAKAVRRAARPDDAPRRRSRLIRSSPVARSPVLAESRRERSIFRATFKEGGRGHHDGTRGGAVRIGACERACGRVRSSSDDLELTKLLRGRARTPRGHPPPHASRVRAQNGTPGRTSPPAPDARRLSRRSSAPLPQASGGRPPTAAAPPPTTRSSSPTAAATPLPTPPASPEFDKAGGRTASTLLFVATALAHYAI